MKKVKALAALLVAATLALGSISVVIAEEAAAGGVAVSEEAKVYDDLKVTGKNFYNLRYALLGTYPVIAGYDDLNAKIFKNLEDAFALATDKYFTDSANIFSVSYKVTENGQFAKIEVTYNYQLTAIKMTDFKEVKTYFVDKELAKEISESDYNTGITPVEDAKTDEAAAVSEAVAETAEAAQEDKEPRMIPVRLHAEKLGFTVNWDDSTKSVILTLGELRYTVTVDKNEYIIDNKIAQLELAPVNQNGSVYVPVSFFEKVIGAEYIVDEQGVEVIAWPKVEE